MESNFFLGMASALWLGILTSISPCPMATNIAAISFIGKKLGNPRHVLLSGLLYTAGRILAYIIVGMLILKSLLSIPGVSTFLQTYMNKILGPILIITGMVLLELLQITLPGMGVSKKTQEKVEKSGLWGALLLGFVFALSFCPVSAALFFGTLIPLSAKFQSSIVLPSIFGIGTGLPVAVFAFLTAFGIHSLGKAYEKMARIEKYSRGITGVVFIAAGIYYCLVYIFQLT
ncbi:aromatic aminobenezylarsenical efflux permease ArsG family transporter [bacterium]